MKTTLAKKKIARLFVLAVCTAGLLSVAPQAAHAQAGIAPLGNGRFYVELKDATLYDALEMVFKAANSPGYLIDPSAKQVMAPSTVFRNDSLDDIIRRMANMSGYLVRKDGGRSIIEPRQQPGGAATGPGGALPGGTKPAPGRVPPANPFGTAFEDGATPTTLVNAQYSDPFSAVTPFQTPSQANAQFGTNNNRNNNNNNNRNNRNNNNNNNNNNRGNRRELNPDGEYRLVVIKHIYAGGIAQIFSDGDVIPTMLMVVPVGASAGGGGGFGGGSGGGGFGGGGFGGGNSGGFGGGGFGGGGFGGGSTNTNTGGGGGFGSLFSDRNMKENLDKVDNKAILEKVGQLPITSWNYKAEDTGIRHIGPMAQDFAAAFGLGESDKRINMVDANGVTLASIQALYQMMKEQSDQIKALQGQVEQLKTENKTLRDTVQAPAATPAAH